MRLRLADPEHIQVFTLDISPRVNVHLEGARRGALAGRPYTVQLLWPAEGRWTAEFRSSFTRFWQDLGSQIGESVRPIPLPDAVASLGMMTRAVKFRPEYVLKIQPVDMNIVFQRLATKDDERFDLIIGTNIFLYYGAFEQALARLNSQAMLKPGGYLLSNDKLQDVQTPHPLENSLVTEIPMTGPPVITDTVFCYLNPTY